MIIREVGLLTHQVEAIKEFYGTLLELDLVEDNATCVSFRAGNSVLSFKKAPEQEKPYYHVAFTVPTNKLADAKDGLKTVTFHCYPKMDKMNFISLLGCNSLLFL